MASKDQIKDSFKEGGKKGQDLAGMAALGGVYYFHIASESTEGSFELLEKFMEGANVVVDESAEERKGGAGDIGKCVLSYNDEQLSALFHVPKELAPVKGLSLKDWVEAISSAVGGEVLEIGEEFGRFIVKADQEKGIFPAKKRDEAIDAGFKLLREKGLVPENDSSDDDVNYAEAAGVEW